MGISHAQPLLLLLVSLFFSPALSKTISDFSNCDDGLLYPVAVKTVVISPYPILVHGGRNGNVTITGYTGKDIPDGVTVNLLITRPTRYNSTKSYSLCDVTACPVAPGPIVLSFRNILTKRPPKDFTAYYVMISITEEQQNEKMMCVIFSCRTD